MNRYLTGKTIVLPRGGDWAESASAAVRERGAFPVVAALIGFAPPEDPAPLNAGITQLLDGNYDWLIVTSPRTVSAIEHALRTVAEAEPGRRAQSGTSPSIPAATKIAAVGDSTANALRKIGVLPSFIPQFEQSARGLVREWPDQQASRVLMPRSSIAEPTIKNGLSARSIQVDDPVAYRTQGVELSPTTIERIRSGEIDYAFLTSGSTVREFARQIGTDAPVSIVTIGPISTRDAKRAGLAVSFEAATPSIPAMLDAVEQQREPK